MACVNEMVRALGRPSEIIGSVSRGSARKLKSMCRVLAAAALLLTAMPASTQPQITSDELARLCQIKSPVCGDYLSAAYEGAMEATQESGDRLICPESIPTRSQLIAYFMLLNILDGCSDGGLAVVKKAITAFKYAMPCDQLRVTRSR